MLHTTTTTALDAQKHELIEPEKFWNSKSNLSQQQNPQEQNSWAINDVKNGLTVSGLFPLYRTHH
jgi:hypothetical protein